MVMVADVIEEGQQPNAGGRASVRRTSSRASTENDEERFSSRCSSHSTATPCVVLGVFAGASRSSSVEGRRIPRQHRFTRCSEKLKLE